MLLALAAASCGSTGDGISGLAIKHKTTTTSQPPTIATSPGSTLSVPIIVTPTTTSDNYPYDPGYTDINQLVADSTFIVAGTLHRVSGIDQNGHPITIYPITVQKVWRPFPAPS
jgi:hypothetical protein